MMACIKCANWLPTQRFDLQCRLRLLWTNASLHLQPFYARRKPPARSAAALSKKARSSSLVWEARAKAQRIVTSSSSVRVGAAVPPKSGYQRFWKACGGVSQLRCKSLRTLRGLLCPIAESSGPHLWAHGGRLGTFYRKERERRSPTEHTGCGIQQRHFRPRGQLASTLARVPYGSRPDESVYVSRLLICHTSATPRFSRQAYLVGNIVRRALMGLAIGATVMTLILSPWGKRSGGHVNPAMTRAFCRLGKLHHWGRAVLRSRTVLRRNDRRRARDIVAERRPRGSRGSLCSDHSRRVWCRWRVCSRISHFSCPDDHGIGRDEP